MLKGMATDARSRAGLQVRIANDELEVEARGVVLGEGDVPRGHQPRGTSEDPSVTSGVVSQLEVAGGRREQRRLRVLCLGGRQRRLVVRLR